MKSKFVAVNYFLLKRYHRHLTDTLIRPCDKPFLSKVIFLSLARICEGCFLQILLDSFLNDFPHIYVVGSRDDRKTMYRKRSEFPIILYLNISSTYFSEIYKYAKSKD